MVTREGKLKISLCAAIVVAALGALLVFGYFSLREKVSQNADRPPTAVVGGVLIVAYKDPTPGRLGIGTYLSGPTFRRTIWIECCDIAIDIAYIRPMGCLL